MSLFLFDIDRLIEDVVFCVWFYSTCLQCHMCGLKFIHLKYYTVFYCINCYCLVTKSCPTLCDPMDHSSLGSSVYEISQARVLEWVSISFSRGYSQPRDWTHVSCIGSWILYQGITAAAAKSLQSCLTLCDPIDTSPPGSPVPGILQARTLEWVAISFSNAWKWKVKVK